MIKRNPTQKALRHFRRKIKKLIQYNFTVQNAYYEEIGPRGATVTCRIVGPLGGQLEVCSEPLPKNLARSLYKKISGMLRRKEPLQWNTDLT